MQKRRKQRQDGKNVNLGDAQQLGGVHVVPMSEFVREDGFDFVGFAFLDERVKDDNVFALCGVSHGWDGIYGMATYPGETEKVGVAVRATFRAVDFVQVF